MGAAARRLWTVPALVTGAAVLAVTTPGLTGPGARHAFAGPAARHALASPPGGMTPPRATAPPTASVISPDAGSQAGGQPVTITGAGFVPEATEVTFNGVPATDVTVAPGGSALTAVPPAAPIGPAMVVVRTAEGATAPPLIYIYLADGSDAVISGIVPRSGPTAGGATVTITGTGLTGAIGVAVAGRPATGFAVDPGGTAVTVVAPPNPAGPARLELIFPEGRSGAGTFTYVAPTITVHTVDPDRGGTSGGTPVTLAGRFVPGRTTVAICGRTVAAADVTVGPAGVGLTFRAPPCAAGDTTVTVSTPAGVSNSVTFRYVGPGLPVTGGAAGRAVALGAGVVLLGAALALLARPRRFGWR